MSGQSGMQDDRTEVDAFVVGAQWMRRAVAKAGYIVVNMPEVDLREVARTYYPPYDPVPEPTKTRRGGMKEPWEPSYFEEQRVTQTIPKAVGGE